MPVSLLEHLKSSLTPQLAGYAAKTIGETPAATERAIDAALPAILSGVAAAARMPTGLSGVSRLVLDPINDSTLLSQLPALYQGTMTAAPIYRLGSQLLHAVFGNKLGQMTQSIAALAGIRPASSALLVSMLSPHVLSELGKRQRTDPTPAGFARLMAGESANITAALNPVLAQVFGAPGIASAAATAATGVASARPLVVATTAPMRGAPSPAARAAAAPSGGLWLIFPAGLLLALGMLGAGAILGPRTWAPKPVTTAASPAPPPVPAPAARTEPAPAPVPAAAATKPAAPPVKVEAAKPDAKPAPKAEVKSAATAPAAAKVPEAKAAPTAEAKPAGPPPPSGTTTFFGQTPAPAEQAARVNPDYKPAAPAAVAAAVPPAGSAQAVPTPVAAPAPTPVPVPAPPGTTSYYGPGKPVTEMAAVLNPDYKPAAPAASATPAPAAAPAAPAAPAGPPAPGVTSFYGNTPAPAEAAAKPNPDYKPAAPAVAAAPAAPAPAAKAPARPAGVTTYFGAKPAPAEQPARLNPDYKPAPPAPQVAAPAATTPAPAPPTAAAAATIKAAPAGDIAACQSAVSAAVQSGPVLFQTALASLTKASTDTLDRVATAFKACPAARLRIEGHTDNKGGEDMNLRLSQERAKSVADYLASKGINKTSLSPAGFGLTRPAVPNSTAANKALNRRIDFIVDKL